MRNSGFLSVEDALAAIPLPTLTPYHQSIVSYPQGQAYTFHISFSSRLACIPELLAGGSPGPKFLHALGGHFGDSTEMAVDSLAAIETGGLRLLHCLLETAVV